jgi:hypothetical protein
VPVGVPVVGQSALLPTCHTVRLSFGSGCDWLAEVNSYCTIIGVRFAMVMGFWE